MALVQKNPAGSDYVMEITYPQGEYGTEGGAQFYQRLKSMCSFPKLVCLYCRTFKEFLFLKKKY